MLRRALALGLCLLALSGPAAAPRPSAPPLPALAPRTTSTPQPVAAEPTSRPLGTKVKADPTPVRLLIDRIGVDAAIEARGLDARRNMLTPTDYRNVAWYNLGPAPGQPGNALVNGHVNWWTGSAVFTRLAELRAGDEVIVVRADGVRVSFLVTTSQTVAANARVASLFTPSPVATLTLITCSGVWDVNTQTDTQRLLVSATLE
jgi:hypothetical protein